MKISLTALFISFLLLPGYSQEVKILSKKKADSYYAIGIYQMALPSYLDLLKKNAGDPDLNLKTGVCLLNSSKKKESIPYLESAANAGKSLAYFYLGQALHAQGNIDAAIQNYLLFKRYATVKEYFETEIERYLSISVHAKRMIANPIDVEIENMGPEINSQYADYVPVVSADESVIIFTSRREGAVGGKVDQDGQYYEDLFISTFDGENWSEAQNMGEVINSPNHDASVSLSADGQKLMIYRMNDQFYGGDLYISKLDGNNWNVPQKIEGQINTPYWEPSACLSADENLMFFSSNKPGGYGGRDIYLTRKMPDGRWGIPLNLGPIVNTPYDDDAPFFHPDGKTLYFSSKGHATMGGFDIFKTSMQENKLWSLPENLGYPINTVDDDIYFVLSADGKRGYYSSSKSEGFGDKDIYVIHMPEEKIPLTVIKGRVIGSSSDEVLKAVITIIDNETKEIQGIYQPNSATGKFIIILPSDRSFKAVIEAIGYQSWVDYIRVTSSEEFSEITKDIHLKPNK